MHCTQKWKQFIFFIFSYKSLVFLRVMWRCYEKWCWPLALCITSSIKLSSYNIRYKLFNIGIANTSITLQVYDMSITQMEKELFSWLCNWRQCDYHPFSILWWSFYRRIVIFKFLWGRKGHSSNVSNNNISLLKWLSRYKLFWNKKHSYTVIHFSQLAAGMAQTKCMDLALYLHDLVRVSPPYNHMGYPKKSPICTTLV